MSDPAILTPQRRHQAQVYDQHRDDEFFGLLWEMGLGKTKQALDVASHLHHLGKITGLLIVAPKAVYSNWLTQEIPPHLAAPRIMYRFRSGAAHGAVDKLRQLLFLDPSEHPDKLRIVAINYDGLRTKHGLEFARKFCLLYRTMIVLDESTAIKNGKSVTAKRCKKIGALCPYRYIATGTPVASSPFAIHSQVEFLCPDFWANEGMRTYEAFRTQFGVFQKKFIGGGRFVNEVVGYRGLGRLNKLIAPFTSRLLKEDSDVDLPPKVYCTRTFALAPAQRQIYDSLCSEFTAELDSGAQVTAPLAITRLMRLQQVASGFVTAQVVTGTEVVGMDGEEITINRTRPEVRDVIPRAQNPRLQLLLSLLSEALPTGKVIVWCRFRRDVELIGESLTEEGIGHALYDGSVAQVDRESALDRFRDPADPCRVLVANVHAISHGVTLTIAKCAIYYTNSHSLEKRLQSEDRPHRIGQDRSVLVIDICAERTVDVKLIDGLRKKFDAAAEVLGDRFRSWIEPWADGEDEGEDQDMEEEDE